MSVFRASNSTVAWPASANPFADGPTERLTSADSDGPSVPPPRRGFVFAVLLALLALLLSAGSALIAWRALGRAEQAFARPFPSAGASAHAPVATYADEVLRAQAGCDTVLFVDLDEPRVNVSARAGDLLYDSRCGDEAPRLALGPGAVAASEAEDADVGEGGCARAIRISPLGEGADVPVRKGLVLCVLTGSGGAGAAPDPEGVADPEASPAATASGTRPAGVRLVRTEVTEVTRDGTANLRVTSWAAPG